MTDKFDDLRNYVAVVENGGINAAAAALGIAKSAVSRRLGDLEARLGVTLIERTTRRFELTAVGRDYHQRASAILRDLESLDQTVASREGVPALSVECTTSALASLVAPALASFQLSNEQLVVDLRIGETSSTGDADVTLTTGSLSASGSGLHMVASFERVICGAPSYLDTRGRPATLADLRGHSGIAVPSDPDDWRLSTEAAQGPVVVFSAPDVQTAALVAIAGCGLAQVPGFVVREAVASGRLEVVLQEKSPVSTTVHATYAPSASVTIRRLVDHLATTLSLEA